MPTVGIFRPKFDPATVYGHAWLGKAGEEARDLGFNVIDVQGSACTKQAFLELVESKPDFIVAVGHGNETIYSGQNREIIMTACQDDQVMTGSISNFLSCMVAQELLPSMVDKDALATIGYLNSFSWVTASGYENKPIEDPIARPFMNCVVESIKRPLQGYQIVPDCYNHTIDKYNEELDNLPGGWQSWMQRMLLEQNRDGLIAIGPEGVYVVPPGGPGIPGEAGMLPWIYGGMGAVLTLIAFMI